MTQDVVALIRDERDRAIEALRQIEEEGLVVYEAYDESPMRDVTAKRANRQRQIIERMELALAVHASEAALAD
jgi:predicted nuclease with RNAse H fold